MTKYRNKCKECILAEPVDDIVGSFKEGGRYYFIMGGKQRMCRPVDQDIRACQEMPTKGYKHGPNRGNHDASGKHGT